jgi:hypothetical protein
MNVFSFLLPLLLLPALAHADGPTTQRELAMQKYAKCQWTDEMGKSLYECVKKNNGFNTHWCFDEALETLCPKDPATAAQDRPQALAQEKSEPVAPQPPTESLPPATIEREKTMLKYRDCKWTDEMGKFTYECVKRNNGFGVHWCHDEAIQTLCPKPDKS